MDETLKGIRKGAVGDRAEFCVGRVENALGFAAGRYFVNETFGGESREKGTKVITGELLLFLYVLTVNPFLSDIIGSFKASLPHIKWMDEESARAAAEKVIYLFSCETFFSRTHVHYQGRRDSCQSSIPLIAGLDGSEFHCPVLPFC